MADVPVPLDARPPAVGPRSAARARRWAAGAGAAVFATGICLLVAPLAVDDLSMATEDLALAGLGCVVLILGLVRAMAPTELPALDLVVAAAGAWLVFGGAGGALSAPGAIAVGAVLLLGSAVSGVCARRATRT